MNKIVLKKLSQLTLYDNNIVTDMTLICFNKKRVTRRFVEYFDRFSKFLRNIKNKYDILQLRHDLKDSLSVLKLTIDEAIDVLIKTPYSSIPMNRIIEGIGVKVKFDNFLKEILNKNITNELYISIFNKDYSENNISLENILKIESKMQEYVISYEAQVRSIKRWMTRYKIYLAYPFRYIFIKFDNKIHIIEKRLRSFYMDDFIECVLEKAQNDVLFEISVKCELLGKVSSDKSIKKLSMRFRNMIHVHKATNDEVSYMSSKIKERLIMNSFIPDIFEFI